ncbi:hypothetical protein WDU94_013820 [Cyamophila willieti]
MDSKVKPKEKRRNSERRKEKSRDAARCRRSKESEIFHDMASLLPLPASTVTSLDKASVMRLAISFLKTKHILKMIPAVASSSRSLVSSRDSSVSSDSCVRTVSGRDNVVSGPVCRESVTSPSLPCSVTSGSGAGSVSEDALYLKALDGFVLVLSTEGDLVFLSENVNHHLGLSQIDLMGQSIYEVTHPCDHNEVKSILSTKDVHTKRSMFIRFKCTLTSKGRNVNVKAATYKVIHCTGHLVRNETHGAATDPTLHDSNNNKPYGTENKENKLHSDCEEMEEEDEDEDDDGGDRDSSAVVEKSIEPPSHCFIAIGEPIPHPSNYDVPLSQTFLTKHSLDMKFTYADETMEDFLGFNPDIFISKSVFGYHHVQDSFLGQFRIVIVIWNHIVCFGFRMEDFLGFNPDIFISKSVFGYHHVQDSFLGQFRIVIVIWNHIVCFGFRMEDFLGFNPDIFISKSVFGYHHAQDSFHVQNAFKSLFAKGQCQTDRYRFLACGGGYVWVLTQATLIYSKCQKAQSVVCVNFVIRYVMYAREST